MSEKFVVVLFSGTGDRLQAAATLVSGAAAMGKETHIFLTTWGVHAFRKSTIDQPVPMSGDYGDLGEHMGKLMHEKGAPAWHEVLRMARDVGDVHIHACGMTADLLDLTKDDLDDMVDDVIGVAAFIALSEGAQTLFI